MKKKRTTFVKVDCKAMKVGDEEWNTYHDFVGLLAEANVQLILEIEKVPTHGGTSKYGNAIRQIHANIVPKKWNDRIAKRWEKIYRAELAKTGDSQTAAEVASQEVR